MYVVSLENDVTELKLNCIFSNIFALKLYLILLQIHLSNVQFHFYNSI